MLWPVGVSPQPRFHPPVNYVFTEAGARFRQNSEYRGRAGAGFSIFFNTGAGAGPGLTNFTYTGAVAGFVEKYRGFTGAGAPVGSYFLFTFK